MFSVNSYAQKNKNEKSASEIKAMTMKQFDTNFEDVYKSALSLLQSEQFSIEQTDVNTGLIIATKNVYTKKRASLLKVVLMVDKLNNTLTEVKITANAGEERKRDNGYRQKVQKVEGMVQDAEFYNEWFTKLQVEIARRQALY
jgi:negative regulator of replication initiation